MDEEYLEAVLDVVGAIPRGRAMTYGLVAEVVQDRLVAAGLPPRGGPRQVGRVMARGGSGVMATGPRQPIEIRLTQA